MLIKNNIIIYTHKLSYSFDSHNLYILLNNKNTHPHNIYIHSYFLDFLDEDTLESSSTRFLPEDEEMVVLTAVDTPEETEITGKRASLSLTSVESSFTKTQT